jgi:hypothetical protein
MNDTRHSWLRTALVVAVIYAVIGLVTVATSRAAGGADMQAAVRLIRSISWLLSAVLFFVHLVIESRSRPKPTVAASHASAAVAMATLLLALIATARQMSAGNTRPAVFVAIAAWPLLTGLVSFAVGVVLSGLLKTAGNGS